MSSFVDSLFKGAGTVTEKVGASALTSLGVPPGVAQAASKVSPGKAFYKGLNKAQNWLGKVISRKKDKAVSKLEEQKARVAQLEALQTPGTRSDTNYFTTDLQKKVFGIAPDEKKGFITPEVEVNEKFLAKFNNKTPNKMENTQNWLMKNWMYLVGGAAALYFLMGRKRR